MKKYIFLSIIAVLVLACNNIEPIQIKEPQRVIDTEKLIQKKSNLDTKQVGIGVIYGWGKDNRSILMNTPDEIDVLIVKDGYENLTQQQKKDLSSVQNQKATKVLMGVDLATPLELFEKNMSSFLELKMKDKKEELQNKLEQELNDFWEEYEKENSDLPQWQLGYLKMDEIEKKRREIQPAYDKILNHMQDSLISLSMQEAEKENFGVPSTSFFIETMLTNNFNGLSVKLPKFSGKTINYLKVFLETIVEKIGKGKNYILIIENPISNLALESLIQINANWIIYQPGVNESTTLEEFAAMANKWSEARFLPSVDFLREDLMDGFKDSEEFSPSGKKPMILDICNWKANNKAGVAFYHIEKNYTDIEGTITYKMLREALLLLNKNN